MNKEQILELIIRKEKEAYDNLLECRDRFGFDDFQTYRASAAWGEISGLLDEINENDEN